MNKIKIKGQPLDLHGELIAKGQKLSFKAINRENKEVRNNFANKISIISCFPDINTRICDAQTLKIIELAKKYPNTKFISITTDDVETINKWCGTKNVDNVDIWSDQKYHDFSKKTNALITNIDKLARGFIIVDANQEIIELAFNEEVASEPNYNLIEKYLK